MKHKTKGILSIIGGVLLLFLLGSYHTWARITKYYISYLHYHYTSPSSPFSQHYTIGLTSYIKILYTFFIPIGAYATSCFGIYLPCIAAVILAVISHIILLSCNRQWLIAIAFIFFSIAIGIGYISPMINAWRYFPEHKGVTTAIILTGFGSSSFVLEFILERMLGSSKITVNEEEEYYTMEVAMMFRKYLIGMIGLFNIIGIVAIGMIKPFYHIYKDYSDDENCHGHKKVYGMLYMEEEELNDTKNTNHYNHSNSNTNHKDLIQRFQPNPDEPLSICLKSSPFYQLSFLFLLSTLFGVLHLSTSNIFGQLNNYQPSFIISTIMLWNITNSLFRIFWGYLLDAFGYKDIYLIVLFIQIFTFSTFYFVSKYKFLFFLYNFLSALSNSGTNIIIPFAYCKTFGNINGSIAFGISQFISSIASFGIPFLIEYLKGTMINFLILFLANSVTSMVGMIILCFIEEKPFGYYRKERDEDNDIRITGMT